MVDVTLIRPLNKVIALVVVKCVLLRQDSWSFLERGQNMATEDLQSSYLEQFSTY